MNDRPDTVETTGRTSQDRTDSIENDRTAEQNRAETVRNNDTTVQDRTSTVQGDRATATAPNTATTSQPAGISTERGDISGARSTPGSERDAELLPPDALEDFRARWQRVQVAFVDQPRDAVQQAHDLVDQVVERVTQTFTSQRATLEGTWTRGDDVSTEDLRQALQQYRSFFNRLLST